MAVIDFSSALGSGVAAFTSDASIDFLKGDTSRPGFHLTAAQSTWLTSHGIPADKLIFPKQVHGEVIWSVTSRNVTERGIFEADAVITTVPGLAVAVRTADCCPVLLYSKEKRVVAAVHAGWKSTQLHIAAKTVDRMVFDHGVDPRELRAVIAPCIRRESYPVGTEFRKIFPMDVIPMNGGQCLDIVSANSRHLVTAGVLFENITDCGRDTYSDRTLHSFRRDGDSSGRLLNVIMMV